MHWGYGWGMGWMMGWWALLWLLVVAAIIWFIVRGAGRPGASDETPEMILKRRYARGEMNREEYEQRLNDLRR